MSARNNGVSVNQGFWSRYKWLIILGIVIAVTVIAIVFGFMGKPTVSVKVQTCAGGTPGVGTNKEPGCLCNTGAECASGSCPAGAVALTTGSSVGKCA